VALFFETIRLVFSMVCAHGFDRLFLRILKGHFFKFMINIELAQGWNTSTAILRVVEGNWEGNPVPGGYNWATLSLGNINTETCSSRFGAGRKADGLAL
jgi:hypothetical protein